MANARANLTVVVLAAGQGKRLRSKTIKLLHGVAGRPMVEHVVETARALRPGRLITVIGHQAQAVRAALAHCDTEFVVQRQQRGTGHAVLQAQRLIGRRGTVLILNGDLPTLRPATLRRLVARHRRGGAAMSVVTAEVADPAGYGRVIRGADGDITRIVEDRDASPAEKKTREINCGIYCADPALLLGVLKRLRPNNAQTEYYLTDAARSLAGGRKRVAAVSHADAAEVLGVNTRRELAQAEATLYLRKAEALQNRGVTVLDPETTRVDPRATVGRDSILHPGVVIEGPSRLGEDCVVRPGCRISNSRLGRDVQVLECCVIQDSRVGDGVALGPFAHLRPGSILDPGSKVGNFVELKKTRLGRGSKANHLTYLGDATVGAECNIGAGTITCNYDGTQKFQTIIGRRVFVGSDTQIVAPVRLGDGAYVAAGTTVTDDVPAGSLALSRTRQKNVRGWVRRRRQQGQRSRARSSED